MTTLFIAAAICCGQFEIELALALTASQPAEQQSVVIEPELQPVVPDLTPEPPRPPKQQVANRTWGIIGTKTISHCDGGRCWTEEVPVYGWIDGAGAGKQVSAERYATRTVTKYRTVRKGIFGLRRAREPYNVTERVRVSAPTAPKPTSQSPGYPLRSGKKWSGCESWQHLTRGEHAGYFDHAWLQSLSWDELQSLHSDHHDDLKHGTNKVQWSRVVRP